MIKEFLGRSVHDRNVVAIGKIAACLYVDLRKRAEFRIGELADKVRMMLGDVATSDNSDPQAPCTIVRLHILLVSTGLRPPCRCVWVSGRKPTVLSPQSLAVRECGNS